MLAFDDIKPGSRLRGLDSAGIAEVVQVGRFDGVTFIGGYTTKGRLLDSNLPEYVIAGHMQLTGFHCRAKLHPILGRGILERA